MPCKPNGLIINTIMELKIKSKSINKFLPFLIFFLGSFLFFRFLADYVEFYQEKLALFVFSHDYLISNIKQPGSLLLYLGRVLTTFFYYPFAGAFIISLTNCLIIYLILKIIHYLSGKGSILIPLIFGILFFILQTNYQYLLFNNLGVLLQLAFFYLATKYLKGYIPVIIFPLWYWITGGFAWIFVLLYTFSMALKSVKKEIIRIISLFVVSFLLIYVLKQFILFQSFDTLLIFPLSNEDTGSQFRLFLPAIALITFIPFIGIIKIRLPGWLSNHEKMGRFIYPLISILLISISSLLCHNKVLIEYFHAERLFYLESYDDLTRYVTKHPTTNRLTIFLNNIALSETGRLNDLLFQFPQSPDGQSLFLKWEMLGEVLRRGGYFYYTTGMINEAHRWAYENMVMKGITPEGLKMLIKTEIINGNYKVASKYISLLKNTLFYRAKAKEFEKLLFNDKAVELHAELGVKRKEKIEHDFFSITDDPYINIQRVLALDSLNRKVYNYKLAYLMITKDYKGIAGGLARLESLGYKKIPENLEEAAMVCRISDSAPLPDLGDMKISPQTEARFNKFLETFQSYGNSLKAAEPVLRQKFGNTFWYWAFYH
jgi:hypothetical protein